MIRVLIIEDEPPAVRRLSQMLAQLPYDIKIVDCIDSVEHGIKYLKTFENMDLIISDIQLSDGNCFQIFSEVPVHVPVIFATAFDDYMLQAFKINSIDYLLKPYDQQDLTQAIEKYQNVYPSNGQMNNLAIQELISTIQKKKYKERFLVKRGKDLVIVPMEQVSYFYSEDGYVHLTTQDGHKHIVEYSLDNLTDLLDPDYFFRISRKYFIHTNAIQKIHSYFNSRLKLELHPNAKTDAIVSREKVSDFKEWLDR